MVHRTLYTEQGKYPMSSNSHPFDDRIKARHLLKRAREYKTKGTWHNFDKYEAVHPTAVSENDSESGMLIILIKAKQYMSIL